MSQPLEEQHARFKPNKVQHVLPSGLHIILRVPCSGERRQVYVGKRENCPDG